MSDDSWRRSRRDDEDFGPPLFADDPTDQTERDELAFDDDDEAPLSFGPNDTGPLPHWTDPPTGELPRVLAAGGAERDPTDDLDVWGSFSNQGPVWRDDRDRTGGDDSRGFEDLGGGPRTGALDETAAPEDPFFDLETAEHETVAAAPPRREPGRITIGTDPTDESMGRPMPSRGRSRDDSRARGGRPAGPARTAPRRTTPTGGTAGRDMPAAFAVGAIIAAAFIAAILIAPVAVMVIVVAVVGLAAVEFFDKVTEKGYRPATVIGLVACVAAPIAAYWVGDAALPLVFAFALMAGSVTFISAPNVQSGPVPNMAITTLGVTWIGLLGSFAALILGWAAAAGADTIGTDTLFLLALGVVANDVGALFVGSAAGKTPLRDWISPNKSIEGLVGGTLATFLVLGFIGVLDKSDTWNSVGDLLLLALVVSVTAPLGDLTESMFKRNLEVKDFGSIIRGHGGVLDRFDGFLFALPATYYLMLVLEPWAS